MFSAAINENIAATLPSPPPRKVQGLKCVHKPKERPRSLAILNVKISVLNEIISFSYPTIVHHKSAWQNQIHIFLKMSNLKAHNMVKNVVLKITLTYNTPSI